ncbi:hypothetical protein DID88_001454 [Monilinia fructigena]|uniref:Nudix hydrolase domain-containing protein n=1 Tax=Monilinia fructigena TaxID=38457 RepID=A0A395IYI5_9HELO|nr:hypothetical protein DID88_001454 [Monilinia fructigena]
MPVASQQSTSTLGLFHGKVFDPAQPPVLPLGFFPFEYLPTIIPKFLVKMSIDSAKVLKTEPLDPSKAKWTKLILSTYRDPQGKVRDWEHAERATRPKSSDVDGVGIVAIIKKETGPELVLQKQYRPRWIKELKEETGYIGVLSESTPIMFNDPGFCNTNLKMVHVEIDMSNPRTKNQYLNSKKTNS